MATKIEIKVKCKNDKIKSIEYVASNRMRYVHHLHKGLTKIYVYDNCLDLAEKALKDANLEYTYKCSEDSKEDENEQ